jgi:hypothetical protein
LTHSILGFGLKGKENDDFRHLQKVLYATEREVKYLFEITAAEFLYTKGHTWEYEKEWRIIRNFNDAAINAGSDCKGKDILLFAIPPGSIRGVVIGHQASGESIERIRKIVAARPQLSHLRFRRTMYKEGLIEIVFEDHTPALDCAR